MTDAFVYGATPLATMGPVVVLAYTQEMGERILEDYTKSIDEVPNRTEIVLLSDEQLALIEYDGWSGGLLAHILKAHSSIEPVSIDSLLSENRRDPEQAYWVWRHMGSYSCTGRAVFTDKLIKKRF